MENNKLRRCKAILILGVLLLSLCACSKMPFSEHSMMDTCAITSDGQMAETENGYYIYQWHHLFYADKSDLTNWMPVCNEPDCEHCDESCPAKMSPYGFWLRNNRIYSLRNTAAIEEEPTTAEAIYSMAPDGTDLRLECPLNLLPVDTDVSMNPVWMPDGIYLSTCALEKNGSWTYALGRVDKDGTHILHEETAADEISAFLNRPSMRGDMTIFSDLFSGGGEEWNKHIYRETEKGFEEISGICGYPFRDGYLDGNVLYHYAPNDGFYKTDLISGKSEKWMDSRFSDGKAEYVTENFVVETNFGYERAVETPEMAVFDGSKWRTVSLPEDIWRGENSGYFVQALTTEHLFYCVTDYSDDGIVDYLYSINLNNEELTAALCGEFRLEVDKR